MRAVCVALMLASAGGALADETNDAGPTAPDAVALYERAAPAVVRVHSRAGNGSGFLVDPQTVATSWHVVEDRGELFVETRDGTEIPVTIASRDRKDDVALLALPEPLTVHGVAVEPLPLRSTPIAIGARVFVLGHPLSGPRERPEQLAEGLLNWSLSDGLVSQVGERAVQVTATVEPGNSGGPLLDAEGRVVGVVGFGIGAFGGATRVERLRALQEAAPAPPRGPVVDALALLGLSSGFEPGRSPAAGSHQGVYTGLELVFDRRLAVGVGVEAGWLASKEERDAGARSRRMLLRTTVAPRFELPFRPGRAFPLALQPYALVGAGMARTGTLHETLQFADPACDPAAEPCAYTSTSETEWQPSRWMPMVGGGLRTDFGPAYLDVGVAVNPLDPKLDTRVLLQFGVRFGAPLR